MTWWQWSLIMGALTLVLAGLYSVLRATLVDWFARMGGDTE